MNIYDDFDFDYYLNLGDDLDDELNDHLENGDEDDEAYRPKKTNSRKSLLPLFVYEILKERQCHRFSQLEILERLKHQPYEISVERKALSRTLHSLEDSGMGICSAKGEGVWFDPDKVWKHFAA